ncbi:winged helix-turn-helix domain-containing protein [Saccharicrinis fermentans]|uniref:DNA-binding transcriptional regulator ModE n=1 Tax=Saccharicrinis fermentans DSM 9555 = JCM 21142 TaxID=869213 RepID=W7YDS9_9BACT|nr:LysR family transcriptional regulator [Saccharicrinis fermentans]GAF05633.1 DNA-binding transcriptional regulator ModE [Saccharicrinis fermentans DSM 9555 = JCM 21142]
MELMIKGTFSIETSDGFVIHPRVIDILKEVEHSRSLNSAVKKLGMSYSHAWNLIYKTNCKLATPLLITKRGGNGGGIATLTGNGRLLLKRYQKLESLLIHLMGDCKIDLME